MKLLNLYNLFINCFKRRYVVKVGVGVIIIRGSKILVGYRINPLNPNDLTDQLLALPGGHAEFYDISLAVCGEREVLEETGIVCKVRSPDGYREELFTTFNILSKDRSKKYVTVYLIADYVSGADDSDFVKPLEPKKCRGWYWKTLGEIRKEVNSSEAKTWLPENIEKYLKDEIGWNFCEACQSYHHPANPSCVKLTGGKWHAAKN